MLINCPLRQAVIASPSSCAIRSADRNLTFVELEQLAGSYADILFSRGVSHGKCVAILCDNSIEYVALLVALLRCGAIAVPLNTRLSSTELKLQIAQIDLNMLLTDDVNSFKAAAIHSNPTPIGSLANRTPPFSGNYAPLELELDRSCLVVFTSGSSGPAKGVILSVGNLYYNALGSNENIPLLQQDTWLLSLPLFHVGGLGIMFRCLIAASQILVAQRFDAESTNRLLDLGEVTHLSLVPTMLARLLQLRDNQPFPATLKAILLGGAPVSDILLRTIRELNLPVVVSYGMTETASQIAATSLTDPPEKLTTSGKALRYCEIRIEKKPTSRVGEICVRGNVVCRGYTDGSHSSIASDGWLHTGDFGFLDSAGYLTVLGREDGMFISGGENIFPEEIENVAEGFPGIVTAAVVAVDNPTWGKRPILFIECRSETALNTERLRSYLSNRLAKFKLPDRIVVFEKLPRTALDKIDRSALARLAESHEP